MDDAVGIADMKEGASLLLWVLFLFAVGLEVTGTSLLAASKAFTVLWPSVGLIVCYSIAYVIMGYVLAKVPLGIAYATWCGIAIVATSVIGYVFLKQSLSIGVYIGVGLILIGSVIVNISA